MRALIQRVTEARVTVAGDIVGQIGGGLLVLLGVERSDGGAQVERMAGKLLSYRVFADDDGRMNRCLTEIRGGLLLVPQFTLAADTGKGMRPSFSSAADPDTGRCLFAYLCAQARARHAPVEAGVFGAHMQVSLVNDGPVTFWLKA